MNTLWGVAMVVASGLFAGGLMAIAWERTPVWKSASIPDFRATFSGTLRRVDRLQPALLTISLVSAIGFAVTASGDARVIAIVVVVDSFFILVGSIVWLVPIQRALASTSELPTDGADRMRVRWLHGHLIRTAAGIGLFVLAVLAAVR